MPTQLKRLLATVLFADMVGYSRLMDENEAGAIRARQAMEDIVRRMIPAYSGEIIQFYGDGVLALFPNTYDAVQCAGAMQRQFREEPAIPVRIGIHTGEIARDLHNVYGDPVNIASRIESFAVPGSVLYSDKVYDDLRNQPAIRSSALGAFQLKNIRHAIRLYALTDDHLVVPRPQELRGKGEGKKRSIAVLPFVNMSADPDNEYFSDGVAEELLNALTQVDTLRVTARTSSFAYKGRNQDVREVGRELGVETVLEGSVRKAGKRVRITAQLIDTTDGYHLLSESYDRDLDDIFAVQDEIARNIASLLKEKLDIRQVEKRPLVDRPTDNMEAYQFYLKGLYYWSKYNAQDTRQALSCFEQATRIDPDFSTAWAAISFCYSYLGGTAQLPPAKAFPAAWEASQQALLLNSRLARAHCAQGIVHLFQDWDFIKAEAAFARAKHLAKDDIAFFYTYSLFLLARGRFQEAVEILEEAKQLDPIAVIPNAHLVDAYLQTGQYEAAIRLADQTLEMYPDLHYFRLLKAWGYIYQEEYEKGMAILKVKIDPEHTHFPEFVASRGYVFAKEGNIERAKGCIQRLDRLFESNPVQQILADKAMIHFMLGDRNLAFQLLYDALDQHVPTLIFLLHSAQWRPLREDPQFQEFHEKMGVRE